MRLAQTPHTGGADFAQLLNFNDFWALTKDVQAVTTDSGLDMVQKVSLLWKKLKERVSGDYIDKFKFYVRYIAHIINLAVFDSMAKVNLKIMTA